MKVKNISLLNLKIRSFIDFEFNFYFFSYLYLTILTAGYLLIELKYSSFDNFLNAFDIFKFYQSLILFQINLSIVSNKLKKPSDIYISIILYLILSPLLVLYFLNQAKLQFLILIFISFWIILLVRKYFVFIKLPKIILNKNYLILILTFILLSTLIYLSFSVDLDKFNLDPTLIYKIREDLEINKLQMYLINWLSRIIIPLLAVISFKKRNFYTLGLSVASLIVIYGITSEKGILVMPLMGILAVLFLTKNNSTTVIPILLSLVILTLLFFLENPDTIFIQSMVIRRSLFTPTKNILYYYEFFDVNKFIYWSNSLIGDFFVKYPYELPVGRLINNEFLNRFSTTGSVNCSFLGTSFMHAGIIGNIVYSIFFGVILKFIDFYSEKENINIYTLAITIVPIAVIITSSDLTTGLISHGLLISLFLLPFLSEKINKFL